VHPPPSPVQANFTLMIECTPESSRCYSVYSVLQTPPLLIIFKHYSVATNLYSVHSPLPFLPSLNIFVCESDYVASNPSMGPWQLAPTANIYSWYLCPKSIKYTEKLVVFIKETWRKWNVFLGHPDIVTAHCKEYVILVFWYGGFFFSFISKALNIQTFVDVIHCLCGDVRWMRLEDGLKLACRFKWWVEEFFKLDIIIIQTVTHLYQ